MGGLSSFAGSNYDPNQPRDEKGQWSETGASGLSKMSKSDPLPAKPTPEQKRSKSLELSKQMGVRPAHPSEFKQAFDQAFPPGSEFANHVTHYTEEQLGQMKTFLSSDGKAGVVIHDHGDGRIEATALFNTGTTKGAGLAMLAHAVSKGANYVECYGPVLNKLYESLGFKVIDRFPFDDSLAAPGWDYEKHGRPDYHTMKLG